MQEDNVVSALPLLALSIKLCVGVGREELAWELSFQDGHLKQVFVNILAPNNSLLKSLLLMQS